MTSSQQESSESLENESQDVESLMEAHRSLDEKVNDLSNKAHLTPEEDLELHQLKKEKLRLKDKIEAATHQQKSA